MEKTFLDVFPGLHIEKELRELLELVMVERVTMPKDRSSIRIYIRSPKLIHKKNIYSMEEGIAKQLFPGRPLSVKILEKYRLSAQYTPKRLYEVYKDSIFLEFRQYGMVEYNILRRAETEFPDEDTMLMTIEDNLIYRERSKEVGRVLEKIFTERCGLPAEVKFHFFEKKREERETEVMEMPKAAPDFIDEPVPAALPVQQKNVAGGKPFRSGGSGRAVKGKEAGIFPKNIWGQGECSWTGSKKRKFWLSWRRPGGRQNALSEIGKSGCTVWP